MTRQPRWRKRNRPKRSTPDSIRTPRCGDARCSRLGGKRKRRKHLTPQLLKDRHFWVRNASLKNCCVKRNNRHIDVRTLKMESTDKIKVTRTLVLRQALLGIVAYVGLALPYLGRLRSWNRLR